MNEPMNELMNEPTWTKITVYIPEKQIRYVGTSYLGKYFIDEVYNQFAVYKLSSLCLDLDISEVVGVNTTVVDYDKSFLTLKEAKAYIQELEKNR